MTDPRETRATPAAPSPGEGGGARAHLEAAADAARPGVGAAVVARAEQDAADPEPRAGSSRERTCVGCGERAAPSELVRLVLGPSGEIAVDAAGGGFGRGAHVHARAACIAQAAPRGLMRATRGRARAVCVAVKEGGDVAATEAEPLTPATLAAAIEAAMDRRIAGLVGTAARTRNAQIGADAVTAAWRSGDAALVVVAADAAAGAELGAVREAVAAGAAVAWGTKQTLAAALSRAKASAEGVAVLAITDGRIAAAVRDAVEKVMGARGAPGGAAASSRAGKVAAPRGGNRSKVEVRGAGRASGRRASGYDGARSGPTPPRAERARG